MIVPRAFKPRTLYYLLNNLWNSHVKDAAIFGPSILLRGVLPRDANGVVTINTRLGSISLRPSDSDMHVLHQVFVEKCYNLNIFPQMKRIQSAYQAIQRAGVNPVIIDAGANIGASSIWFSKLFPKAKIVAVEPDPQNAELCRRNTEQFENVTVVEAAIGSVSGKVTLELSTGGSWGTMTKRGEGGDVRVVTVKELLAEAGASSKLFIIKIDIEGFEKDLFSSETSWLSEAEVVVIELHDFMLPGQYSSLHFQKAMLSLNAEILTVGENLIFVR